MPTVEVESGSQPPASAVRKFLSLLEQSDIDFSEELGKSHDQYVGHMTSMVGHPTNTFSLLLFLSAIPWVTELDGSFS